MSMSYHGKAEDAVEDVDGLQGVDEAEGEDRDRDVQPSIQINVER